MPPNALHDLTGESYGAWDVLKRGPNDKRGHAQWLCECDCGTVKVVCARSLRWGDSKSCGCLKTPLRKVGIPLQPFIDAFKQSGLSEAEVARRAGHIRGNGYGDGTWLARVFGRRPYSQSTTIKRSGLIHPRTALELANALNIAPVDCGL